MIPFTASKMSYFLALSFDTNPSYNNFTLFVPVPVVEDPIFGPGIAEFDFLILNVQALAKIQGIKFFDFDFFNFEP